MKDQRQTAVKVEGVYKNYGEVVALTDINLNIHENELFGVIGPDGAGKTTLFRILTTLLIPDSGSATILSLDTVQDYRQIRPLLGYMPGRFSLYQDLSVEENIRFYASVFGTTPEKNMDLIEPIYRQLEPFKKRLAGKLSGGMKQKLALSCALIHRPKLLVLDEPTTGVDAVSRMEFWEMLQKLKSEGITIIVSTPYMDEARKCDRVALMQEGRILMVDQPEQISAAFERPILGVQSSNRLQLIRTLRQYPHTRSAYAFGEYVHYTDKRDEPDSQGLKMFLVNEGVTDVDIIPVQPGIEDTFMELMQQ